MNMQAYIKLINKKINSAHAQAKNPFMDGDFFATRERNRPEYTTLVWVEPPEKEVHNWFKY